MAALFASRFTIDRTAGVDLEEFIGLASATKDDQAAEPGGVAPAGPPPESQTQRTQ